MSNENKLKGMSISLEPDMQQLLKVSAKKAGKNVSSLIRDLVDKHLSLVVNDGEEIPVILKVPAHLKGNEEELRTWLLTKSNAIIKALCAEDDE